jgi:hypothetical protein
MGLKKLEISELCKQITIQVQNIYLITTKTLGSGREIIIRQL